MANVAPRFLTLPSGIILDLNRIVVVMGKNDDAAVVWFDVPNGTNAMHAPLDKADTSFLRQHLAA